MINLKSKTLIGIAVVGMMLVFRAGAHDCWLAPASFHPQPDERFGIAARIGDQFNDSALEVSPPCLSCAEKFTAAGPDGEMEIHWQEGSEDEGTLRFSRPGAYVIGYTGKQQISELEAVQFEHYLADRGLLNALQLRKARGASEKKGREAYIRYMKSLVRVGNSIASDRVLGMKYEIVAEAASDLNASTHTFRVLFNGKPLKGALVRASRRNVLFDVFYARSDANGRVNFQIKGAGVWLISTVHMIEAQKGVPADWQSFWATLTFES